MDYGANAVFDRVHQCCIEILQRQRVSLWDEKATVLPAVLCVWQLVALQQVGAMAMVVHPKKTYQPPKKDPLSLAKLGWRVGLNRW